MSNLVTKMYSYFNEFRIKEKFYDVVVIVGDRKFPCHRIILASALEYFRSMFLGSFNEAGKNEVELKFIAADDFEVLLTHIYGGSVSFNGDRAYRLLKISEYLCVPSLVNLCTKYLSENANTISLDAAINVFVLASEKSNLVTLADEFVVRLAEDFANISTSRIFVRVPGSALLKVLGHPNLRKDSDAILNFLAKWMKCHQTDRDKKLLPTLLQTAKLEKVPNEWLLKALTDLINVVPLTMGVPKNDGNESRTSNNPCDHNYVMVEEEFFNNAMDKDIDSLKEDEMKLPCEAVLYIRCGNTNVNLYKKLKQSNTVKRMSFENDSYHRNYSIVWNCKSVFVENVQFTTLLEKFSANSSTICYRPYVCREFQLDRALSWNHVKCCRDFSAEASVSHGTNIFFHCERNFDVFNCQTNQWAIDVFPEENSTGLVITENSNLLSDGNRLYLVGGKRAPFSMYEKSMETCVTNGRYFQSYDLRSGVWSQLPKLKYARSFAASCLHKNILYVSGGDDLMYQKGYIECYDFTAGKWRTLDTLMPEPKMNHTLCVYNDQLWFYGGKKYDSDKMVNDLTWYSYNLNEETWSDVVSLSTDDSIYGQPEEILDVVVTEG